MNWMFPYDVSTTTMGPDTAGSTAPLFEPDCPTSPADGDQEESDSVCSPSAASFSSSSSSTDHLSFITSTQRSTSASPLCFGAGKLLWRSNAHVSKTKREEAEAAPKGDVVRRYLRKISRRLRKARRGVKESSPPCRRGGAVVDDTARERAEALASAVAYCKESLRRGTPTLRLVSSPSLDCWLQGWREDVVIASAAAHCNECTGLQPPPPPCQPGWILERQAKTALRNDASRIAHGEKSPHHDHYAGDESSSEAATAEQTEKPSPPSDSVRRDRFHISGSFNEIEFLKTCNGEDEIIGLHFITIRI